MLSASKRNSNYFKNYYQKNKEKIKESSRKWSKNNKEKKYNTKLKWRKKYPEKPREYARKRKLKKLSIEGFHTLGEWELLKKQYGFICPSCKKREPEIKLTRDHIIPISKGGSDYIENIQPLCGSCNSKKYTKIIIFNVFEHGKRSKQKFSSMESADKDV